MIVILGLVVHAVSAEYIKGTIDNVNRPKLFLHRTKKAQLQVDAQIYF